MVNQMIEKKQDDIKSEFRNSYQSMSLAYTLQRMREQDDLTHVVTTATSSLPYAFVLKELDKLMYPKRQRLKFVIYDPRLDRAPTEFEEMDTELITRNLGKFSREQHDKLESYFMSQNKVRIAVFDECSGDHGKNDPRDHPRQRQHMQSARQTRKSMEKILEVTDSTFFDGYMALMYGPKTSTVYSDDTRRNASSSDKKAFVRTSKRDEFMPKTKIPWRNYFRATGKSGKEAIAGYREVARKVYKCFLNDSSKSWSPYEQRKEKIK